MLKLRNKLLLVFTLVCTCMYAQSSDELLDLVARALQENYQVQIIRNNELVLSNNNTPGNAGFLPMVSLSGNRSNTVNNTIQKFFNGDTREGSNAKSTNLNGLIRADWVVFDGFGMFARGDQLQLLQDMGGRETRFFIEQTISDLAQLYSQLVAGRSRLSNLKQSLAISRFRHDLEKKKLAVGSSNALIYNQALIDYNSDSVLVLDQERMIKSLEIQINRITNRDPEDAVLSNVDDITSAEIEPLETLIENAIQNNTELELSRLNELLAETDRLIQKADLYPVVTVFGQYAYNRNTSEVGFTELNRSYGTQYGVNVRFNLFNGNREKNELLNSKIEKDNRAIETKDIVNKTASAITDLFYQYQFLRKQLEISRENVIAAQKSQLIAREQLEKQAISGYDFRLTQLSVINAFNSVTQLELNLKMVEIQLSRMTGALANQYL